ncbi:MAG: hemerythrin family protein [Deltaproteobacteria bacterium]
MTSFRGPILDMPEMDSPHREMVARAEELAVAARSRNAKKAANLLDELLETTAFHFAQEDEWMDRTSYPDRVAHRTAHDLFLQDLHASALEIRAAGITPRVLEWACGRLPQWIRFHMEKNDRPLARHIERATIRRTDVALEPRS